MLTEEQIVLEDLVTSIQGTGGLIRFTDGFVAPEVDEEWTDLGSTVEKAYNVLKKAGVECKLDITDVSYSSKEI